MHIPTNPVQPAPNPKVGATGFPAMVSSKHIELGAIQGYDTNPNLSLGYTLLDVSLPWAHLSWPRSLPRLQKQPKAKESSEACSEFAAGGVDRIT